MAVTDEAARRREALRGKKPRHLMVSRCSGAVGTIPAEHAMKSLPAPVCANVELTTLWCLAVAATRPKD